ncbi:mu-protocadherin [Rhodopirellula sp. JC740]|uniref:Mu-protocadherin n=1 Tax=Rhodopirellula halodulae TaxID=2894198 RepID=A0ABS8NMM1_9BACT|nr:mu-protocadherin [Rhodopirellula sp. JC740]MCC9644832.1 mu-protocadherin [Rhodopirellula sp. JC740]
MGGAVMLLMVATMGITFGWTPDGADGVKYIIQVPPDQLDQLSRVGEISSTVSPEVRGRVSEIVIRIGNGNVPRVTPASWKTTNASHPSGVSQVVSDENALHGLPLASDDLCPVPIPATGPTYLGQPTIIPGNVNSPSTTRLMKPQSGGMNLPGGFDMPSTAPSTAANSAATGAAAPSNGFGIPPSLTQGATPAASTTANAMNDAAGSMQGTMNDALRSAAESFSDAARRNFGLDKQPTANSANNTAASSTVAPPPFTGNTNTGMNTDRAARAGGPSTAPSTGASSTTNSGQRPWASDDQDWYSLNNRPAGRPSTTPRSTTDATAASKSQDRTIAPTAGGNGFSTGNFNQFPSGLGNTNAYAASTGSGNNSSSSTIQPNEYDPRLTPAEADRLPQNGYSFNAAGEPIDREGNRLNAYGQRIDAYGRPLSDTNYTATNGQTPGSNNGFANTPPTGASPIDSRGNTASGNTASNHLGQGYSDPTFASHPGNSSAANTNANSNSGQPNSLSPNPNANGGTHPGYTATNQPNAQTPGVQPPSGYTNQPPQYAANPNSQHPAYANQAPGYPTVPNYNQPTVPYAPGAQPNAPMTTGQPYTNVGYSPTVPPLIANANQSPTTGSSNVDRTISSPGDRHSTSTSGGGMDSGNQDSRSDREKVATQTLFNALLLVSFVANLYLMYWLNVLRLKYQEMVAAKRAAASSNPATAS